MREITKITVSTPFREHLASIDLLHGRRFNVLASLAGVLAFICAGVSAADTVRVTNPATQPVLTSRVDEAARVPYQVQLLLPAISCEGLATLISCRGSVTGVPAGKRLVVQAVSGAFNSYSTAPTNGQVQVSTISPSAEYFAVPSISTVRIFSLILNEPAYFSAFQAHETVYVDGGAPVNISVELSGSSSISFQSITVTGYVIDCTAAPCAPIVTQ
jgi:hypothetical protein